MFKLIVTRKSNGNKEESDFATEQECINWWNTNQGYWNDQDFDHSVVSSSPAIAPISPRQISFALSRMGIEDADVEAAIENSLSGQDKKDALYAWRKSLSFKRDEPAVEIIGALLGLSSNQLDSLWTSASVL